MSQIRTFSSGKLTALLADDDDGIQLTLSALLERKGFEVTVVDDGDKAVEAVSKHKFDIALLDIRMPQMDGFEACRAIRKLEFGENLPLIMLTGQDDTESIETAFDAGATDFIAKPINYVLIGFRIDYILRAALVAEELRKSQQRSRNAQRIAHLGHVEWNQDREILHCSKGVREILRLPEQQPISHFDEFIEFVHPDDRDKVESSLDQALAGGSPLNLEHRMLRIDGGVRFVLQSAESRQDPQVSDHMVVTIQDITDRIDTENRMHVLAYYDDLTGLPNRSLLIQHLDQLLKAAVRFEHKTAVIVFGVDKFDKVVESLDHHSVEELIRMIAERIKNTCRECDLLSRRSMDNQGAKNYSYQQLTAKLRNDEYVIVLSAINSLQAASTFLQRLMEEFEKAFPLPDRKVYVTVTAGISLAPIDGNSSNQLIKNAEIAKGFANKQGAGSIRYFKQELNEQVTRKVSLANDLRKALTEGTLEVHYQPKIDVQTNALAGVEALCRWHHPGMGLIAPSEFVEIAEEEGLIGELGNWVLKTACNQLLEWRAELDREFGVSVNISPGQLLDERSMQWVFDFVSDCPLDNQLIEFELTESTLLENFETSLGILNRFVDLGCSLAIDDFGTGYSSLSYLGQLPANALKIDRSFLLQIESSKQYRDIVGGTIKLAHNLGMTVIAEGVESEYQRSILREECCDQIQGHLVSLPLSPGEFIKWLNNWEARESYANPVKTKVG